MGPPRPGGSSALLLAEGSGRRGRLSVTLLSAFPHEGGSGKRESFLARLTHALQAAAPSVNSQDRARLLAWIRFIHKLVLLGETYAQQELRIAEHRRGPGKATEQAASHRVGDVKGQVLVTQLRGLLDE